MFNGLRLRLTALYLLVGLAFVALVGVGSYALLRGYYQWTTDLALQHRLVADLREAGAPVPAALAAADSAWYAARGRQPPVPRAPAGTALDSNESDEGAGTGDADSTGEDGSGDAAVAGEGAFDEEYDGELAAVFKQELDRDGRPVYGATGAQLAAAPLPSSADAVARAMVAGMDWRTVVARDGTRVRMLSYRLASAPAPTVLQLGRPLDDQERALRRLLAALLGLGAASAVLMGAGGWWLAGRALHPAEQAWRQQQDFVANASHELRTPLTLIRATAEVLSRGLVTGDDRRSLVADILAETDHMTNLVRDLLLLSRLDSGRLELHLDAVQLDDLFDDLERQFGRLAGEADVEFTADGGHAVVRADGTRLRQVLLALLDNALHHTPIGGTIRLDAARESDRVCIEVADTGSGIAAEHLSRVFERFYRAETRTGQSGAGLGLAVAKALIEAQGGDMRLDSQAGAGTRVTVRLPAA